MKNFSLHCVLCLIDNRSFLLWLPSRNNQQCSKFTSVDDDDVVCTNFKHDFMTHDLLYYPHISVFSFHTSVVLL